MAPDRHPVIAIAGPGMLDWLDWPTRWITAGTETGQRAQDQIQQTKTLRVSCSLSR